ncbi:MAG: hypothetical protein WDW36_009999 [Sanguina aurantia]
MCSPVMCGLIAAGGTLFSWGLNEWRLGRRGGDNSIPEAGLLHLNVVSIAGSRHSAVATAEGHVYTMGHNDSRGGGGHGSPHMDASGQLGRDGGTGPGRVMGELQGRRAVQVVTGRYHTLAVTDAGEVFSWGLNDHGQLGRVAVGKAGEHDPTPCYSGASCHDGQPRALQGLEGVKIVGAAAGRYTNMAVDREGRLYVWGMDGCSTGSLPAPEERWRPRLVGGPMQGRRVVAFDSGYVFWVAADSSGAVWSCNHQDDGYAATLEGARTWNNAHELGRGTNPLLPGQVEGLGGVKVTAVAAGREHALAVTSAGQVYSWGGRNLLAGRQGDTTVAGLVAGELKGGKVLFVAAGEYFSLAASASMVYGWGSNDYLATGLGRFNPKQTLKPGRDRGDVAEPVAVSGPLSDGSYRISSLVAGFQHAMAIAVKRDGSAVLPSPGASLQQHKATARSTGTKARRQNKEEADPTQAPPPPSTASTTTTTTTTTTTPAAARVALQASAQSAAAEGAKAAAVSYLWPQSRAPSYNVTDYWASWRPSPNHAAIVASSSDVFESLPSRFDPRYRNPCWEGAAGSGLRCIPYYHILGVSKCGTTDLYHRLAKHPDMYESLNKGPHWWDECIFPSKGACTTPPNGDFEGYIDLPSRGEASSNTFTSANGVYLRGPSMTRDPLTVTLPQLMREASPFLRLIIIFRDPVDRYFSAFYYYRWWQKDLPPPTAEDFHSTAVKDIKEFSGCVSAHSQAHCVRLYNPQQLVKGMYSEFMQDWTTHWPRDQLLFLRNEDYRVSGQEHMSAVFSFLGMRNLTEPEWSGVMDMGVRNKNSDKYEKMLPKTRQLLNDFYKPYNERLAGQLKDDRYLWKPA